MSLHARKDAWHELEALYESPKMPDLTPNPWQLSIVQLQATLGKEALSIIPGD